MITCVVLTDTWRVDLDSHLRFNLNDQKISIKSVPFVRYRFSEYTDREIEYIKEMKKKFKYSIHMAEVELCKNIDNVLDKLNSAIENLVIYVYIPVTDDDVKEGLGGGKLSLIRLLVNKKYERIMLKDKSTSLDFITAEQFKKQVAQILVDIKPNEIGICQSPLSFEEGNSCLTAIKAREIAAEYAERDDIALPSANHQCMNTCGCIRYVVIDKDLVIEQKKIEIKEGKKLEESENKKKSISKKKIKGILKW